MLDLLYDESSALFVLGSLCNDTSLLDEKHPLSKYDFRCKEFDKIIFVVIKTLKERGAKSLSEEDFVEFLKNYPAQYEIFNDNDGVIFIDTIKKMNKEESYDVYYDIVRKFSLLSMYKDKKFDISMFYNEDIDSAKAFEELNKHSIKDIIEYYEGQIAEIKREFNVKNNAEEYKAGTDFAETKKEFMEEPLLGASFQSPYMNSIFRGMYGFLLRVAKSGGGKAQPVDTIIPTPIGYRRLGDIKVGDYVYDRLGKPTKVLGVFPQGMLDCYTVTLADGRSTQCNNEHLWSYYNVSSHKKENRNKLITKTLGEIMQLSNNVYIPINKAIEYDEKQYNIDPYVIGSFIGNGCCKERILTLSSNDEEQVSNVAKLLNSNYVKSEYNYNWFFIDNKTEDNKFNRIYIQTKSLFSNYENEICVYSYEKRIPNEYKYGSIEQRFSLIQGLMDTDGSICIDDGRYNVTYTTTSFELAKDVAEVVRSLGYICSIRKNDRVKNGVGQRTCYILHISVDNSEKQKFFRLSRKLNVAKEAVNFNKKRDYNRIGIRKIVKEDYQKEMVCIYVDNEEHLYLTNDFIVTHNTTTSVGDLCKTTIKEYYDPKLKQWVKNKSRVGAGLFINTEMDLRREVDPMIIAWISNVSRSHIMDGRYEGDEEERVDYATKVLLDSELYIVDDPEFTTKSLQETIADYVLNKNIKNICFDYVQNNGFVAKEISNETKVPQREDMVLLTLTDRLKQAQRKYGVGLISSCQTNGNENNLAYPNESCLAGGKSQIRKTDGTYIMLEPTNKELEQTKPIFDKIARGNFGIEQPNNVVHIIKGRASKYPKHMKIFQYIDLGTCRTYDLFCTDKNNCPINVDKLIIEEETE